LVTNCSTITLVQFVNSPPRTSIVMISLPVFRRSGSSACSGALSGFLPT
jgi:hypothetical protein